MQPTITDRTVLVTGGGGFIGGHLADALAPRNDVRVLDNFSSGRRDRPPEDATVVEGDVRDDGALATAMEGVDTVFHHAAMVDVPTSIERPRACHETNAGATVALLEHARQSDARVVFASSAAVYGHAETVPIPESAPTRPRSPYGIAKLSADLQVRRYADLYDLPTVALRYFNVYGPGQGVGDTAGVIDVFFEQAQAGEPITIHGEGDQTRDFVHVEDVVRANLLAATTDHTGEAFNVGTGTATSVSELAELVLAVTDSDAGTVHREPRSGDVTHSCADVEKAADCLDYEPSVTLRDGLASLANPALR